MRTYEERAKDFIKEAFDYLSGAHPATVRADMEIFNRANSRHVQVKNGIARIALITSDYVVKYDYDEDEVESVGGGESEVSLYAHAVEEGFDYLFAKVTRYEYRGRKFYIMPRIHGVGKDDWNYADHYMTADEESFCNRHDLCDLHGNNYGFRNGKVCIVDYACRRWCHTNSWEEGSEEE